MSPSRTTGAVLLAPLLLAGCAALPHSPEPAITITKVPPFAEGSPNHLETIEGRVVNARSGQRIVLYARAGDWWIQPFADAPFTTIQRDAAWKNQTHPGSAYAALLVSPTYRPNPKTHALPQKGPDVLAIASSVSPQTPPSTRKTLLFAGYEWNVRDTANNPGGSHNNYDAANAWVDAQGHLHLRIAGRPGHWTSAEVNLRRSLGYGSYRYVLRDVSHLEPAVVFTMLTWDDAAPSREMDIEVSKWGETFTRNGQFVIQPYHVPANTVQFDVPAGPVTFMLRWSPGRAAFRAFRGVTHWDANPIRDHVFTSGVPSSGSETVHMNLYVFDHNGHPLQHGSEVVVDAFEYLP